MERRKQTGHICRWMALGITISTIVVGCTIVIGLFEWRDRSRMESRNAELHLWRKSMYDLNMHIAKPSLLGETAVDWDSAAAMNYHALSREVSKELQNITNLCTRDDVAKMQELLEEKERLLLSIRAACITHHNGRKIRGKIKICIATQDNNQCNNPFFNFLYMPFGHNCDQ